MSRQALAEREWRAESRSRRVAKLNEIREIEMLPAIKEVNTDESKQITFKASVFMNRGGALLDSLSMIKTKQKEELAAQPIIQVNDND